MLACTQPYWAVARRLVGRLSAATSTRSHETPRTRPSDSLSHPYGVATGALLGNVSIWAAVAPTGPDRCPRWYARLAPRLDAMPHHTCGRQLGLWPHLNVP